MWNVLENGYLDPHAMTRIDFSKERGRVSRDQFPLFYGKIVFQLAVAADDGLIACFFFIIMKLPMMDRETNFSLRYPNSVPILQLIFNQFFSLFTFRFDNPAGANLHHLTQYSKAQEVRLGWLDI